MRRVLLISLLFIAPYVYAQLSITEKGSTQQAIQLVKTHFAGDGIIINKVSYRGNDEAIGHFEDNAHLTGFGKGIVLGTGRVELIAGANTKPNTSTNFGDAFFSDKHIITKSNLCDGAVLEIDFIPQKDSITLGFIFGSEEYPEFVGKEFNDLFKILLQPLFRKTTPQNLAQLADNNVVGVNTINYQNNSEYYVDNTLPAGSFYNDIEFDGFTKPIHVGCRVMPGKLYRLKIILVDLEDCEYDSGVLLEAYSFRSISAKAKMSEPAEKRYVFGLAKSGVLANQSTLMLDKVLDSLNRYAYDSIVIGIEQTPMFDSLTNDVKDRFKKRNIKCSKLIIVPLSRNESDKLLNIAVKIIAYRKPL